MDAANESYVDMRELWRATGAQIAGLLGAEAAFVTSGCAAAIALGTAACMTGDDIEKMERIPDTTGMKNQVVLQRGMQYKYDRQPTIVGGKLVLAGDEERTTEQQLLDAIGPDTACVMYLARMDGTPGLLPLDTVIRLAHSKGVPVLLDAAAEVYPLDYFTRFFKRSADLVCYGAKYFGGPHSTGILAGRKDLVESAFTQSFVGYEFEERKTFGRPLKVDRQECVGAMVALREWMTMDHESRLALHDARRQRIMDALDGLRGVTMTRMPVDGPATFLAIDLDEAALGKTAAGIVEALKDGDPPIWIRNYGSMLRIATHTLRDGEERVIAERLREELTR